MSTSEHILNHAQEVIDSGRIDAISLLAHCGALSEPLQIQLFCYPKHRDVVLANLACNHRLTERVQLMLVSALDAVPSSLFQDCLVRNRHLSLNTFMALKQKVPTLGNRSALLKWMLENNPGFIMAKDDIDRESENRLREFIAEYGPSREP